ncbi:MULTISPECIES: UvrD-helicase domain-containing protein [Nitrosomonas]|uniref:DNA 3'-5' helicase n=1 Tax=Nitrosomonas communis TaxID=44574 RepID=A0A0F7KE26_9PROT|nr:MULTISPECIES: UvrD-helicase domain-containing protein [Nitrosomonas]AKH37077.1 DNA helicase [Nitrosomonas communis]TYP86974.1 DNA helicase-2/ATP-dependent DNA helicase PcrA [Nitrosomonas communis]UVS62237.1 UvrD-helicase domain-containing protein [Nitrosomonas sp. PLL12]
MISLLSGLNPEQLEAVTLPYQSSLILAGAGSGKTRVLTTRIAYLIQSGQVSPNGILAVTFTNKAAREMMARIAAMLPINTRGMWIGTFHGLCHRMLRAHYQDAGLPQTFLILDIGDQQAVIKRLLKDLSVDEKVFPPRQIQWFINHAKEEGLRASQVEAHDNFTRRMLEFYRVYETLCMREGMVDFAELLLRCYELLTRNEILCNHYRDRFRHILVDEFQDTNRLQYRWLKLLAGGDAPKSAVVFAVGDDDQSIYAFRGAHTGNMQELEYDFAIEKIIKLEQNYRSHGNILEAANALIEHNRGRFGKNLWTSEGHGEPVRVYNAVTDFDEAAFIVDEIKALHAEGVALSEIALLYRSNAQSRVLEHSLFNASLSYRVYGGMRFFERQEIKHALAYLRLIAHPDDDHALLRVINFPPRGIGARTLEQLQDEAKLHQTSLWAAAFSKGGGETTALVDEGRAKKGLPSFINLIMTMQRACVNLPLPETIRYMLTHSGLLSHYGLERDGAERLENLNELINAATSFVHEAEDDSLVAFLSHASLEGGEHQADHHEDALQLMTVHAAKGLEFHTVFLSGLEEGLFPHGNSRDDINGLEEERRLMYVAMTRARRRLYLSFSQSRMLHGQTHYNIASRFINEIPDHLLKWLQPQSKVNSESFQSVNEQAGFTFGRNAWGQSAGKETVQERVTADSAEQSSRWRIGQNVSHAKFGTGVIINYQGQGSDIRVQVQFNRAGTKWLLLEYAKLTPL